MKPLPALAFVLMAASVFAQDEDQNSFVQHIKSPAELEYEDSMKEKKREPDDDNAAIDKFAKSYFYAYRHGDIGFFRSLVSPDTRKCLDNSNDNYFRSELANSTHTGKIDTLKWTPVDKSEYEDSNEDSSPSQSQGASDRQIEISWKEETVTVRHIVTLTPSGGQYYMSVPCSGSSGQAQNSLSQSLGSLFGNGQNNGFGAANGGYGTFGGSDDGPSLRDYMTRR